MDGEGRLDELVTYLSRLTGATLSADEPTQIRSIHRAALSAWARKRDLPISFGAPGSGGPVRLRDLLAGGLAASVPAATAVPAAAAVATIAHSGGIFGAGVSPIRGIGIDIEEVDAMPEAGDYREHAFYRDNFTDAEMAHCIRQANEKASFCGLWAAKEAIFKAGLADVPSGRFKGIEITRDALGRPGFPGAQLSISHTPTTAVAVCIAFGTAQPASNAQPAPERVSSSAPVRAEATAPPPDPTLPPLAPRPRRYALGVGAAAGIVLAALGGAVSLAFGF